MKPIRVSIAGFNSFRENVNIDFEELGKRGIFGIFGKTGSGKSTILDAITFALYGVISRYGTKYGNCINENETEAKVELEFAINDTVEHRYIVRRSIKRKGNGDYNSPYAILIDVNAGNLPIAEKTNEVNQKVEDLLGLNYDEFVKTVVLPQGSFKDFLVMEGSERRKILERIFGLGKYGEQLQKSASEKKHAEERKKAEIDGQMALVKDVSEAILKAEKEAYEIEKAELIRLRGESEKYSGEAQIALKILEIREKLEKLYEERRSLEEDAEKIETLKKIQAKSEKAEKVIPVIQSYNGLEEKIALSSQNVSAITEKVLSVEQDFEKWNGKYEIAKERYDNNYARGIEKKSRLEGATKDFQNYTDNQAILEEIANKLQEVADIYERKKHELGDRESQKEKYAQNMAKLEEDLSKSRELVSNEVNLNRVFVAFKSIAKLSSEIERLNEEIKVSLSEIEDNLIAEEEKKLKLDSLKQTARKSYIERIKQELHEGDICPICNSKIEGKIHVDEFQSVQIANADAEISEIESVCSELKSNIARQRAIVTRAEKDVALKTAEMDAIKNGLDAEWVESSLEKLEVKLAEIEEGKTKIRMDEADLKELKAEFDKYDQAISELKEEIANVQTKRASAEAEFNSRKEQQSILKAAIISILGEFENPESEKKKVEIALDKLEKEFKYAGEQKEAISKVQNELKQALSAARSEQATLKAECDVRFRELCEQLGKYYDLNLADTDEELETVAKEMMKRVLAEYLNPDDFKKNKSVIEKYSEDVAKVEGAISQLQLDEGNDVRPLEELELIIKRSEESLLHLESQKKKVSIAEKNIENATEKLKIKQQKQKELAAVEKRISLLDELLSLFGARKFAEYMAIEQLRYITKGAGETLSKITGGKYKLVVSEDGTFRIQDFKNGGIIRGIKSMSGGETFVVSLSLALALSAQLQLKGRAPIELFFLDEGFGTLDDELLDTVMDALERLANPRFNIGIVSHVEQLKQRVPIKLIVTPAEVGKSGTKVRIE